jgi:hypothetical protein
VNDGRNELVRRAFPSCRISAATGITNHHMPNQTSSAAARAMAGHKPRTTSMISKTAETSESSSRTMPDSASRLAAWTRCCLSRLRYTTRWNAAGAISSAVAAAHSIKVTT